MSQLTKDAIWAMATALVATVVMAVCLLGGVR
jgi:hypothetical protein